jgi:hypothetical protein
MKKISYIGSILLSGLLFIAYGGGGGNDTSTASSPITKVGYFADFFDLNFASNSYETAEKLEQLSILQGGYKIHIEKSVKDIKLKYLTSQDPKKI